MRISVATYVAYTFEVDTDESITKNDDVALLIGEADSKDPVFQDITRLLDKKGIRQFDADIISICDAETGEILFDSY